MRRLLALAVLVLAAASARAEDPPPDPARLTLVTERAVVFKDGYALVVKSAVATSGDDGVVWTEDVPDAAVLGSFWATSDGPGGRLVAMTAGTHETVVESAPRVPCEHVPDVLAANAGRRATLELDDGSALAGEIRKVLGTALVAVTTDAGDVVLPVGRVRHVVLRDAVLDVERKTTERRRAKRLSFRFEGGAAQRTLRLMYFRPGVRWIPSYRIELPQDPAAPRRAKVRMQAELLNEAEDLVDVPVDVVVGVPNFRFKDTVSPFVLEAALRDALRQAAPHLMGQQVLGANAFSNRASEFRVRGARDPAEGAEAAVLDEIAASRTQDLFTYSLPRTTLRRGERAAIAVFEAEVAYRDVYTCDLHVRRRDVETSPAAGASPLALSDQRVWHQVELVNATKMPWTTGAALLLQGAQPLGQELLAYTSPGTSVRVPVTVAIEVRPSYAEEETGRDLRALSWRGHDYARIDKVGRATVASSHPEAIDVEVRCTLGGRADAASHGGAVVLDAFHEEDWERQSGDLGLNNRSVVTWTLRVEPRGEVTAEVRSHYFLRR